MPNYNASANGNSRVLYFDIGNVLAHFDHQLVVENLLQYTNLPPDHVRTEVFASGLQSRYETGEISSGTFCHELRERLQFTAQSFSDQLLLDACSNIFWLNHEIVPVVAQLAAAGHRLGVLSNTCEGHWKWLTRGQYRILPSLFPLRILSFEVGSLKPGAAIYEEAIRRSQVPPGEVFFVDDRPENVERALRVGVDARLFQDVATLFRNLQQRNIIANY